MAKYEKYGKGNFDIVVSKIHQAIMSGSATVSHEESSKRKIGNAEIVVNAYERYAYFGKNRTSLTVTVVGSEEDIFVSAIATGGSQAVFFKVNTWSEASFLDTAIHAIDQAIN